MALCSFPPLPCPFRLRSRFSPPLRSASWLLLVLGRPWCSCSSCAFAAVPLLPVCFSAPFLAYAYNSLRLRSGSLDWTSSCCCAVLASYVPVCLSSFRGSSLSFLLSSHSLPPVVPFCRGLLGVIALARRCRHLCASGPPASSVAFFMLRLSSFATSIYGRAPAPPRRSRFDILCGLPSGARIIECLRAYLFPLPSSLLWP